MVSACVLQGLKHEDCQSPRAAQLQGQTLFQKYTHKLGKHTGATEGQKGNKQEDSYTDFKEPTSKHREFKF